MNSTKSEMALVDSVNVPEEHKSDSEACALEFSKKDKIAGCFDFHRKPASNSSTEHGHQVAACRTFAGMLSGLFRSKSESTLLKGESKQRETDTSQTKSRRRFIRIVRDENAVPPEMFDDNPHTLNRYSQSFLETYYSNKKCTDSDSVSTVVSQASASSLSYVIPGHTILKKSSSDRLATSLPPALGSSPMLKHATFFDEVEVIEYDLKDKVKTGVHYTHYDHIHDDDYDDDILNDIIKEESDEISSQVNSSEELSNTVMDSNTVCDQVHQQNDDAGKHSIFSPITPTADAASAAKHPEPTTKHIRLADRIAACQSALSARRSSITSTDSTSSVAESTSSTDESRTDVAARIVHIDRRSASPRRKKMEKKQVVDEYLTWTGGILSCM